MTKEKLYFPFDVATNVCYDVDSSREQIKTRGNTEMTNNELKLALLETIASELIDNGEYDGKTYKVNISFELDENALAQLQEIINQNR